MPSNLSRARPWLLLGRSLRSRDLVDMLEQRLELSELRCLAVKCGLLLVLSRSKKAFEYGCGVFSFQTS